MAKRVGVWILILGAIGFGFARCWVLGSVDSDDERTHHASQIDKDTVPPSPVPFRFLRRRANNVAAELRYLVHVRPPASHEQVEGVIVHCLRKAIAQRWGFERRTTTDARVHVFMNLASYEVASARWRHDDNAPNPRVRFHEGRIEAANRGPQDQFGLREEQRRQYYVDLLSLQDRIPAGTQQRRSAERSLRNTYGVSKREGLAITMEASEMGWPDHRGEAWSRLR